jgi:hypothetical protein
MMRTIKNPHLVGHLLYLEIHLPIYLLEKMTRLLLLHHHLPLHHPL